MTDSTNTSTKAIESYNFSIKAMNDTIGAINYAIDALPKETLKKIKESLTAVTGQTSHLPIGIKEDIKALSGAKSKQIYIDGLEIIKDKVLNSIQTANNAITDIKDAESKKQASKNEKASKQVLDVDALSVIAQKVKDNIETAINAHFESGRLLNDALNMFKSANKSANDWVIWADLNCNVKKAQAYNLVKIWNNFGQVSEFKGCSMRVLNTLVHLPNDVYKVIEEQAKTLSKKGKLDTKAVNALIETIKPKTSSTPKSSASKTAKSNVLDQPDSTTKAIQTSIKTENADNKVQSETELSTSKDEQSEKDKLIEKLLKQNAELLAKVDELTKAVQEKETSKTPSTEVMKAVYLPQFDSTEAHLVLGISPVAGKEEILKRYRTMAVIFNAKTCPSGAKALKIAKDSLVANCK